MDSLFNEKVTLIKKNGDRVPGIKAAVTPGEITSGDEEISIEVGDTFERILPAGQVEHYEILDPGYIRGPGKGYYISKVKNKEVEEKRQREATVVYNVSGPNARLNINSNDSSTNVISLTPDELFDRMEEKARSIDGNAKEVEAIIEAIDELRVSYESGGFWQKYTRFMQVAANHAAVFAPFMPALSQLVS